MRKYPSLFRTLVAGLSLTAISFSAQATDRTWNNTGTDFNTPGDWNGGIPDTSNGALFNTSPINQPNVSSAISILQMKILLVSGYDLTSSPGVSITLTGTGTGSTGAIQTTNASGTNTIDAGLILGAAAGTTQTFGQSTGGTLLINGVISGGNSTSTLSLNSTNSSGLIKLTGTSTFLSNVQLIGSGSVISVGLIGNSGSNGNLGAGTTISFASNSTLKYTGAGETSNRTISLNNTSGGTVDVSAATGALIWSGDITSGTTGAKTITFTGNGFNNEIQGKISDGAGGGTTAVSLNGYWILSGSNSFSGGLVVTSGTLGIKGAYALGTGTFNPGANSIDNASGAPLTLLGNTPITLNNATGFTFVGTNNLDMGNSNVLLAPTSNTTITVSSGTLTFGGNFTESAAGKGLIKNGAGTLVMNGSNSFTGLLSAGAGTLVLAGDNSLASGGVKLGSATSVLDINNAKALGSGTFNIAFAGTIDNTSGAAITLTTNNPILIGTSFTFAGSNDLNLGTGSIVAITSSKTITVNSHTLTIGGNLNGTGGAIVKSGSGTLVLAGTNTYTGATTVNGGTLKVNGSLSGGSTVTVGGVAATGTPTLGGGIGSANGGVLLSLISGATSQVYGPSATVGNIAQAVTVSGTASGATAGHLAPGNSVGTLTVGTLTLSGGSILDYEFNGSANDFTMVTTSGGLTINGGGFNLYQEGGTNAFATSGTYDLIGYTGSLAGTGTSALSVLNQQAGKTYVFGTALVGGTNYITLTISGSGVSATSTTYSLASTATTTKIFTSGSTSISSTITNTGTGTADTLDYTGLGGSATGGSVSGSTTSGTGLANAGGSATNSGQTYVAGTTSGTFVVNPVGTGTNHTLGTSATLSGSTPVSVSVYDQASLTTSTTTGNQATPANLILTNGTSTGGASGQRAGVTVTGLSASNVQATDNTNNFAAPVATGSAVADAHGTTTSATVGTASVLGKRLNGTYTETVTGTTRYTDNTLNGQASVANQTWNITATVSGNASTSRSDVYTANVLSGKAYGTSNSSGFSLGSNLVSSGHQATTATLLNSSLTASATTDVNMSFDKTAANSVVNSFRSSDILTLSGLNNTSPISGVQLTDVYVLQLSYDTTATGVQYLGWNNGSQFVNAISGDSTGNTTPYLDGNEVVGAYSGQTTVGTYGYDPTNHVVWAVLNHGGITNGSGTLIAGTNEFAAIPEPSTWGMILGGFGMLVGFQKLRRRHAGA